MGHRLDCLAGVLVLAASLQGQQSQGQQPQSPQSAKPAAPQGQTKGQPPLLEIYQIDLDPTGTAFALGKPRLEGDTWVYRQWPAYAPANATVASPGDVPRAPAPAPTKPPQ